MSGIGGNILVKTGADSKLIEKKQKAAEVTIDIPQKWHFKADKEVRELSDGTKDVDKMVVVSCGDYSNTFRNGSWYFNSHSIPFRVIEIVDGMYEELGE